MSSVFDFDENSDQETELLTLFESKPLQSSTREQNPLKSSKRHKPQGLTFPKVACFKNITHDLSLNEHQVLEKFIALFENWGYRSGIHNEHERFELKSAHQNLVLIQKYSDIVFRSLWSIKNKSRIYVEDIFEKLETCDNMSTQRYVSSFVASFLKENFSLMYDLAHLEQNPENSCIYTSIIVAARSLILISIERFEEAFQFMQDLLKCFEIQGFSK